MIRRDKGELVAECDDCGEEFPGGVSEFNDFIQSLKDAGWRIRKDGDDWVHICTCCSEGT